MATIVLCAALLAQASARAPQDQFVLLDVLHTHTTETKGFSYFPLPHDVPDHWKAPVDFYSGTIQFRLEVISKPSDRTINYQLCVFQDRHSADKHSCDSAHTFTGPGVQEWRAQAASLWQSAVIDWNRQLLDTMLVIKDKAGHPVDDRFGFGGKWDGSPDFALYYPMTVRLTAVVVAKGAAYNPACLTWRLDTLHFRDLKELKRVAGLWERGQLGAALSAAEKELESKEAATVEEAKRVVEAFRAWADQRRKELEAVKTSAPDWAPGALARLGQQLSPASLGKEFLAQAKDWEKDPSVLSARKAKPLLDALLQTAGRMRGKGKASDPEVARKFAGEIAAIAQLAARLRKEFPETPSCRQALEVAAGLAIRVPE